MALVEAARAPASATAAERWNWTDTFQQHPALWLLALFLLILPAFAVPLEPGAAKEAGK